MPYCGKQFVTPKARDNHIENFHESLELQSLQNEETRHNCNHCGKKFYLKSTLTTHFKKNHQEKSFMCELCGKKFLTQGAQSIHKLRIHDNVLKHNDKPQTCDICNETFPTTTKYLKHMKESHKGITPKNYRKQNTCEFCGKVFNSTKSFHNHKKYHHKKELNARGIFKCFGCEKSCNTLTLPPKSI